MNILDYKLYVFDLDGVIIDSEKLHWEAYKEAIGNDYEYFNKNVLTFENCSFCISATIKDESTPPERNAPSGTSACICDLTA